MGKRICQQRRRFQVGPSNAHGEGWKQVNDYKGRVQQERGPGGLKMNLEMGEKPAAQEFPYSSSGSETDPDFMGPDDGCWPVQDNPWM